MNRESCKECGGKMIESIALLDNVAEMGVPDFIGNTADTPGQTVHFRSNGQRYSCLKCSQCGWSVMAVKEKQ